jgi:hypothetical protein
MSADIKHQRSRAGSKFEMMKQSFIKATGFHVTFVVCRLVDFVCPASRGLLSWKQCLDLLRPLALLLGESRDHFYPGSRKGV